MKTKTFYTRYEDQSKDGTLNVYMQEDGDVLLILDSYNSLGARSKSTVEFRFPGDGGGQSPHTRLALIELAKAIEKDNNEHPLYR